MATTTRKTPIKYRRGKPIPTLKHGDLIDWTTFPLHSKPNGRPIELCPKCGRKGERTRYNVHQDPIDPDLRRPAGEGYTHLSRFETVFWMVKDSCHVGRIG